MVSESHILLYYNIMYYSTHILFFFKLEQIQENGPMVSEEDQSSHGLQPGELKK